MTFALGLMHSAGVLPDLDAADPSLLPVRVVELGVDNL